MGYRELDEGDRDYGDCDSTEVVRVVADVWHPSFAAASVPVVPSCPTPTGRALSKAAVEAARRLKAQELADAEAVRAAHWNRTPEKIRMLACHMAGIDAKRGKSALNTFDAGDRAKINAELRWVIPHLQNLMRSATGGKVRDHGEMGPHSFDGIATPGVVQ